MTFGDYFQNTHLTADVLTLCRQRPIFIGPPCVFQRAGRGGPDWQFEYMAQRRF